MKRKLVLGMMGLLLSFGLVFAGCTSRADNRTTAAAFSGTTEWGSSLGHMIAGGRGVMPNAAEPAHAPYLPVLPAGGLNPNARHRVGNPLRVRLVITNGIITAVETDAAAELACGNWGLPAMALSIARILEDNGTDNILSEVNTFNTAVSFINAPNTGAAETIQYTFSGNLANVVIPGARLTNVLERAPDAVSGATNNPATNPRLDWGDTRRAVKTAADIALASFERIDGVWVQR